MSKTLAPSITTRDPKGLKFVSIVEAAYNKAGLSEEEAQRVNNTPGLAEIVSGFIAENRRTNLFANEEVSSGYAYPKGYKFNPTLEENLQDLENELAILRALFPELTASDFDRRFVDRIRRGEVVLPKGAERWTLITLWETLAPTYGEAVEKVLAMIASKRKFCNYREGQLGAEYLRQHEKTKKMFQKLGLEQKDFDILVVPAQFGLRYKGRSVRRAREVFAQSEFGLGAFGIGMMLLTHPEREVQWEQLHVDCAGDEFAPCAGDEFNPGADGDFSYAPLFDFYDGKVGFDADWFAYANGHYGSASAFLPAEAQ